MKYILLIILAFTFLSISCRREEPADDAILGLASPVMLAPDTTEIHLRDYFDIRLPDSLWVPEGLSILRSDSILVLLCGIPGPDPVSMLHAWSGGVDYGIILKRSGKVSYTFSFNPRGQVYQSVNLVGDINNWNSSATPLAWNGESWSTMLTIDPGVYHYQVIADGSWMLDPNNPEKADNNIGGYNSLMRVGDPDHQGGPVITPLSFDRDQVTLRVSGEMDGFRIIILWDNLPVNDFVVDGATVTIDIPARAAHRERSFIRVFTYNAVETGNDLLIPLSHGKVVADARSLGRSDYEAAVMYFVFTDRWNDGDTSNNPAPLDSVLPPADYHGGDLAGILQKMKEGWFEKMGINTIWISPVTEGPEGAYGKWKDPPTSFSSYHGYWPVSSSKVDPRIGDEDLLKTLIAEAHKRGINVLFDWVANHVHQEHPLVRDHPDWFTPLYLPDGSLNIERWDDQRLTTWFDLFLPTLDLERPEVYQPMSDSAVFWLKKFGVDGFRHDATKHIPQVYWRTLTLKEKAVARQEGKRLYQVGETFGSRDLIGSYVSSGMLDAQFDFSLYFDARAVFSVSQESFTRLNTSLLQTFRAYGYHHVMGNITGNHDMGRFTSYAGGGLSYAEDAKQAGWDRKVVVGDTIGYDRMAQLMTFIMTVPGIPVIYYGDEFGMPGGADPDNRRMMKFDGLNPYESALRDKTEALVHLRREHMSLTYGDFRVLGLSDSTYAYQRTWFGETAVICFNKSAFPVNLTLHPVDIPADKDYWETLFGSRVLMNEQGLNIELPPYSSEVLISGN